MRVCKTHGQEVSVYGFESRILILNFNIAYTTISLFHCFSWKFLLFYFLSFLSFLSLLSFPFLSLPSPFLLSLLFFFLVCIHLPNPLSYSEAMEHFVKPILETIKIITLDTKSRASRTFLLCRGLTEHSLYAENLVSLFRCLKVLFCFSFPKGGTNCWFKLKGKISTLCVPFILHPISLEKEQN